MTSAGPPMAPFAERIERLRRKSADLSAHDVVITDAVNIRYLCGFTGSNGSLAVSPEAAFLVTDGRYTEQAAAEAPHVDVVLGRATADVAVARLAEAGATVIAFEAAHLSVADFERFREATSINLVATTGLVEGLRRRKDDGELHLLRRAGRIISDVLEQLAPTIEVGMTEQQVARQVQWLVRERGGDDVAFETIVATGPNSAIPHHSPTDRPIATGDLLKIDAGARYAGYHSDITRAFVVGAEPTDRQREIHDAVAAAAAAARALVAVGVAVADADVAARKVLADAGLEERYTHGLGHGIGLQIHEAPMVSRNSADTIASGDVLTIEPGAYLPGFGGVRVEDTLAVTDSGTECLTPVARDLIRLG